MTSAPTLLNDRYEVDDLIGRGGVADVHRAHDRLLDRAVAVKMLRDASSDDAARFADEARLLAALEHPHIVRLLDAGVADDRPWIVLELVEGPTLGEVMGQTQVDLETVTRVGRDIASALAHAHASGVVHRDVKPGNILIAADGTAKLTDFGIAKLADSTAAMTLSGHTIGTAAYLSPEQVRGEKVTGAGDVYALGLVLREALTAVRAYPGSPIESAVARLSVAPLIPTSLPTGWPSLIAAMTDMDPTERPSAVDVALRLELPVPAVSVVDSVAHTRAVPVVAPVVTPVVTSGRRRGAHRARRRGGLLAGAAAAVVLAGGALVVTQASISDAPAVADPSTSTTPPS
ncbi:serine/threonine-protein kinase, partial [Nocardioides sp.]|uniref:serine/threonine-protein kinase n=1 Tax=Nocardioides sp. TaxID=35761 RepID=UPI002B275F03